MYVYIKLFQPFRTPCTKFLDENNRDRPRVTIVTQRCATIEKFSFEQRNDLRFTRGETRGKRSRLNILRL